MNVRYRRESNHSYLIRDAGDEYDDQRKMVMENRIEGLIRMDIRRLNGKEEFYYDITGKQSLQNIFLKRQMTYEDIRGVLCSVYHLNEELKRYLVQLESILFEPEFCFYNPDTGRAEWIFGEAQEENYLMLAEFILEHADHEDKKGVDVGYKFYKLVKEENFVIDRIITYMDEKYPVRKHEEEEVYLHEEIKDTDVMREIPVYAAKDGSDKETAGKGKPWEAAFERCKQLVKEKFVKGKEEPFMIQENIGRPVCPETLYRREEEDCKTMLIMPPSQNVCRQLRAVRNNEIIRIPDKLPCIIGKDAGGADIVIASKAISRVHARIYEQDGVLFLQDLNSKNGTFKNALQLEPNEKVELRQGDEICFANLQYLCE